MPVRLNITMDERLYDRLRAAAAPKKMSAFISEALREKLRPDKTQLDQAYKAASREAWRRRLADEWSPTETEHWPE